MTVAAQARLDRQPISMLETEPRYSSGGAVVQQSDERRSSNFSQRVKELTNGRGVDVVFDGVGAAVWDESLQNLKPGGRLVITGVTSGSQIPFNLSILQGRPLTLMGSGGRSRRSFAAMVHMVHYGSLRGVVGRTFELAEVAKAHEVMSGRDFFGKLALRVP